MKTLKSFEKNSINIKDQKNLKGGILLANLIGVNALLGTVVDAGGA